MLDVWLIDVCIVVLFLLFFSCLVFLVFVVVCCVVCVSLFRCGVGCVSGNCVGWCVVVFWFRWLWLFGRLVCCDR